MKNRTERPDYASIQVLDRVVLLLNAVAKAREVTLKVLALETGLHTSTAFRILAALVGLVLLPVVFIVVGIIAAIAGIGSDDEDTRRDAALLGADAFLPKPIEVEVAEVKRGLLRVTVDEDGRTRIKERYVVAAPLAGQLLRIKLKPGHAVEAGKTIVAAIDPPDPALLDERARAQAEAQVRAAEARHKKAAADLERAQATFEFASKDLARARDLRIKRSISQQDYDLVAERERISAALLRAAQFEQQVAVHELEMARAALLRTHSSPGERMAHRLEIPSPIRGRVLRVFQESEAVVTPGTRLLELGDPTDLEIEIDVLSADAVKIKPGAKVYLEHWGGPEPLLARVRLVEPAGFLKISALGVEEQRVWVIADFVDPPEKRPTLGDAYRVEARIVTWEEEGVLKVPAGALFRKGDGWAVYRAANGRAVLRSVTVGQSNALEAQILDGLSEGERVIVHPSDKVKDGVAIQSR